MPIKINSWNCCLGVSNKIETVARILYENKIDILFVQEAEITKTTPLNVLNIKGYSCEFSPTIGQNKSRMVCFVKNSIKYVRLENKEDKNVELIALKVSDSIICGFYRPYLLPNHRSELDYMIDTWLLLEELLTELLLFLLSFATLTLTLSL